MKLINEWNVSSKWFIIHMDVVLPIPLPEKELY